MELMPPADRRRAALDKIRAERDRHVAEIEATVEARLSLDETVTRLVGRLRDGATRAEQQVLSYSSPNSSPDAPTIDAAFLLWLHGADFEKQLRARLKSLLPGGALAQADRPAKVAALRTRLAELEREEEIEVCRLEAAGLQPARRSDVDLQTLLAVWDEPANAA